MRERKKTGGWDASVIGALPMAQVGDSRLVVGDMDTGSALSFFGDSLSLATMLWWFHMLMFNMKNHVQPSGMIMTRRRHRKEVNPFSAALSTRPVRQVRPSQGHSW
jgi:hypothetical protein